MVGIPSIDRQAKGPDHGAAIREVFARVAREKPENDRERDELTSFLTAGAEAMVAEPRLATVENIDALANVALASDNVTVRRHVIDLIGTIGEERLDLKEDMALDMEIKLQELGDKFASRRDSYAHQWVTQTIRSIRNSRFDKIAALTKTLPKLEQQ